MSNKLTVRLVVAVAFVGLTFSSGCQTTAPMLGFSLFKQKAEQPEEIEFAPPARMAVIWKESAVSGSSAKPTRGFGGRVYFYNEENETVRVDGELIVFAYDDSNDSDDQSRVPDRKYVFQAKDLQRHHSETGIGDSYSIWLPWDKVGGYRKTIALVPVFKPVNGKMPQSDHSIAVLSGTNPPTTDFTKEELEAADAKVRQVSMTFESNERHRAKTLAFEETVPTAEGAEDSTVRTTTFELPPSITSRMRKSRTRTYSSQPRTKASQKSESGVATEKPAGTASAIQTVPETSEAASQSGESQSGESETPSPGFRPSTSFGEPGPFGKRRSFRSRGQRRQ